MRDRVSILGLILMMTFCVAAWAMTQEKAPAPDYDAAFEQLKSLVGEWEEADSPHRQVTYRLTGNGTSLIEEFSGRPAMTTVYHMDGENLRLTHFCNAGNQPRMKATAYDPASGALNFRFVDVTNLSKPTAYHTRDLDVVFQDEDHVLLTFTGRKNGKDKPGTVSLIRRR